MKYLPSPQMTSFQDRGRKAALTTQQAWRLQSISQFLKAIFLYFYFFRQPDSFLNSLRCRWCRNLQSLISLSCLSPRLFQGWPPSVRRADIPEGTTQDLYWNGWCPSEKFWKRSLSPFFKIRMWITSLWRLGCNYCMMGLDWVHPRQVPSSSHERRGQTHKERNRHGPLPRDEPRQTLFRLLTHMF